MEEDVKRRFEEVHEQIFASKEESLNHIKQIYERINSLKDNQMEVQKEIISLQKQIAENQKGDFQLSNEMRNSIKKDASGSGMKVGAIVSAIIAIISFLIEKFSG